MVHLRDKVRSTSSHRIARASAGGGVVLVIDDDVWEALGADLHDW
jgi:hypothetical protein